MEVLVNNNLLNVLPFDFILFIGYIKLITYLYYLFCIFSTYVEDDLILKEESNWLHCRHYLFMWRLMLRLGLWEVLVNNNPLNGVSSYYRYFIKKITL